MDTTAQGILDLNQKLRADASGMVSLWDEVGRMCLTRRISSLMNASSGAPTMDNYTPDMRLLNTVAVEANKTLAAGCVSWITPPDSPWFALQPVSQLKGNDAVESWLTSCTEIVLTYLSASNFHSRIHECFLDRGTFGTGAMSVEAGQSAPLVFRTFDTGSYVIAENEEALVDTVFRERELTAKQAFDLFGDSAPQEVKNDLSQNKPTEKHRFVYALHPRDEKDRANGGPMGMRFAGAWVHVASKTKVAETGFEELPVLATRYLRWSEASAYGCSPAMEALAEIRGVNYLELLMTTLAEVTVNPRVILPQGYQGVPDLRAGGITMGGMGRESHPMEWMTGGRFDIGLNLIERKEKQIQELFHKSLFDQFSQLEREVTATEIRAREAEKLARFSPAFTILTTEVLNPLIERVFMLLMRAGRLPAPPQQALMLNAAGETILPFPRVVQTSRMALALQSMRRRGFEYLIGLFAPLVEAGIPVLDNLNADNAFREMARGEGLSDTILTSEEERDSTRQARAQAAQAAQQQEMLAQLSKSTPIAEAGVEAIKEAA